MRMHGEWAKLQARRWRPAQRIPRILARKTIRAVLGRTHCRVSRTTNRREACRRSRRIVLMLLAIQVCFSQSTMKDDPLTEAGGFPHPYPSPAPANGNGNRTPFPPPLTLSEYKYPQPPLTPHSGTMSGFATAPLAPPQEYQIPQMSAPAETTAFSNSYLSRHASIGSAAASPGPPKMDSDRPGRLSFSTDRGYGHKRQRSSSHPPSFTPNRDP